ncbi:MAG: hypothetical protein AAB495_04255 [Patescibacteria group bacterium]
MGQVFPKSAEKFPAGKHWAIIRFGSIHVPGDQRSRECPGHGYPASDVPTIDYIAVETEEEWKTEVERLTRLGEKVVAGVMYPAQVTTRLEVKIY